MNKPKCPHCGGDRLMVPINQPSIFICMGCSKSSDRIMRLDLENKWLRDDLDEARDAARQFWDDVEYMDNAPWIKKYPWLEDE